MNGTTNSAQLSRGQLIALLYAAHFWQQATSAASTRRQAS